jgi:transposase
MNAAEVLKHEIETSRRGGALFDDFEVLNERKPARCADKKATVKVENLKELEKRVEGPLDIFGHAAEQMKIDQLVKADSVQLLNHLISQRITAPASKRRTRSILEKDAGFNCSLDSIYRLLTRLGNKHDEVNRVISNAARDLFDSKIDLMFFDVTTLYFESTETDELREFGFSKDCKFGEVQVTLALAAEKNGFPIGYKLFPGNTAEVSTLISCIEDWKKSLAIDEVVFVADRGMFSAKNLHCIQTAGYKFVVGCPLKKLGRAFENQIFEEDGYQVDCLSSSNENFRSKRIPQTFSFKEKTQQEDSSSCADQFRTFDVRGHVIVCHSVSRAKKDAQDRTKMIEKAKKKYEKKAKASPSKLKELVGNRGYSKYLKINNLENAEILLDEDKIQEDAKWDGLSGVFTNSNLSNIECLSRYRGLWQIEECFRISKSHLKVRPIFHFSPKRIQGHIALCFLSLAVLKFTQLKLAQANVKITIQSLTDELSKVGSTLMEDKFSKTRFRLPSKLTETSRAIYKALGVKRSESASLA